MIFLLHATENSKSIASHLGLADYSYYFVMRRFVPILSALGEVYEIEDAHSLSERVATLQSRKQQVVVLSFAPPHRVPQGLPCPVFPVFAWEYSTLPNESWGGEERHDWAGVLRILKGAITHSCFAVKAVQNALGPDFPVCSLPAPVWDDYQTLYREEKWRTPWKQQWRLDLPRGVILDSRAIGLGREADPDAPSFLPVPCSITLTGPVYTAVFNPNDGRKNWHDLISAFCFAFREEAQVTLLMKLVHHDPAHACTLVWTEMRKLAPYRCRVVAVHGFLDDSTYRHLVAHSSYIVNTAHGEGQCLPLMEFMSAGKPAIAPDHTAMADYLRTDNAFILRSSEEWTHWPHDPRMLLRTMRYRLDWESLRQAYVDSLSVLLHEPQRYAAMSAAAHARLRLHCSQVVVMQKLACFLQDRGFRPTRWLSLRRFLRRCTQHLLNRGLKQLSLARPRVSVQDKEPS